MTNVTADEFRLHPDQYLAAAASGDVIVTQDGEPWIVLRSVSDDQDRLSAAYANSPQFWQLIAERRREPGIPWEDAKQQLDLGT